MGHGRPPQCIAQQEGQYNIPLAYLVHCRCRHLAFDNAVFELQDLVNSMLQLEQENTTMHIGYDSTIAAINPIDTQTITS